MSFCTMKRRRHEQRKSCRVLCVSLAVIVVAVSFVCCLIDKGYLNFYAKQGMKIQAVYQMDYTETVCRIDGEEKSVASSGCGATCLSMVITYLTSEGSQTPHTLFVDAYENGDYEGHGLTHEAIDRLAEIYGIQGVWIEGNRTVIVHALKNGYPVIAHMGPGTFTNEGHYILLRGITEDGRILVNDPSSRSRSARAYSFELIENEAKGNESFRICWAADENGQKQEN